MVPSRGSTIQTFSPEKLVPSSAIIPKSGVSERRILTISSSHFLSVAVTTSTLDLYSMPSGLPKVSRIISDARIAALIATCKTSTDKENQPLPRTMPDHHLAHRDYDLRKSSPCVANHGKLSPDEASYPGHSPWDL